VSIPTNIIYYLIELPNGWDVIREGQTEGFDFHIGTFVSRKYAESAIKAYIDWQGGSLFELPNRGELYEN
jgi:hypothetical protein